MSVNEYAADALERMAGYYDARYPDPDDALTYITQPERLVLETGTPGVVAHPHICAQHELVQALQEQINALRQAVAQQSADISRIDHMVHQHLKADPNIGVTNTPMIKPQWADGTVGVTALRTLPAKDAMRLAELEAKWAAIPWEALGWAIYVAVEMVRLNDPLRGEIEQAAAWHKANAPQEEAHA